MAEFVRVKRIVSEDERHALEIVRNPSGQYRFSESEWAISRDDVDRKCHGDGYWTYGAQSGLYESAEAAEADARQSLRWLRESQE